MYRTVIAGIACLSAFSGQAQECSTLLGHGIYNTSQSSADLTTAASFSQWFCDQNFSSSQAARAFGVNAVLPFDGLVVGLGLNANEDKWQESYSSFCGSVQSSQQLQRTVRNHVMTISPDLLNAFNKCVSATGLHVWLERTEDPIVFNFAAKFVPPSAKIPLAKITGFQTGENVGCTETPTTVDSSIWRTQCKRKNDKPVSIIVNADWSPSGGGTLTLPAIPPAAPPQCEASACVGKDKKCGRVALHISASHNKIVHAYDATFVQPSPEYVHYRSGTVENQNMFLAAEWKCTPESDALKSKCNPDACVKLDGSCGKVVMWAGATNDQKVHGYDIAPVNPPPDTMFYSAERIPHGWQIGTSWSCK